MMESRPPKAAAASSSSGNKNESLIQAIVLLFSPGDIFEDIAIPGGIPNVGFVDWYERFTQASERNVPVQDPQGVLPFNYKLLARLLFRGTMPVVIDRPDELAEAAAQHINFDMLETAKQIVTKDSIVKVHEGRSYTVGDLGITQKT